MRSLPLHEKLTGLVKTGIALNSIRDVDTLLETVVDAAMSLCGADGGTLYLARDGALAMAWTAIDAATSDADLATNSFGSTNWRYLCLLATRNNGNAGFVANPNVSLGLIPFDLTRGGSLFAFHAAHNINQAAFYVQDSIKLGNFLFKIGFRGEHYDGLVSANGFDPRAGIAYNVKKTGTVLRVAYARTFETPFNENLLLSNATGTGGLAQNVFGANSVAIQPGQRNQFNGGLQRPSASTCCSTPITSGSSPTAPTTSVRCSTPP